MSRMFPAPDFRSNDWEPYEAYSEGDRKHIGWNRFEIHQERLNNGNFGEYISGIANDGNHFIFRPGNLYEEIRAKAKPYTE